MHKLKPFPNAAEIEFKEKFVERYSKLTDWETFKKYSLSFLRKTIRVNTLKISVNALTKRLKDNWKLEQVPWCKEGFWIEGERRDIGNLPEHVLGYIYVQESASMIPPVVLNPKPGEVVLDIAAAPGSKTTQLAQYMNTEGLLIANDISHDRLASLGVNLQRCGVANSVVTMMKGHRFMKYGQKFDKILLDAPCSGIGSIRKSLKTIQMWNPDMVKKLAGEQRQLIKTAFSLLKENGTMVYSTCTLEPEENEGVVDYLLKEFDNAKIEKIELNIKRSPAILEFEGKQYDKKIKNCLRIWPQDNDSEGFFIAKIKKE
ncbi:RsmB/NOP family class I SAM-dependent RNA methyltransferase [Candidatus Woesearchaeota archaeon]|nr:RsmB/NOP family class I SAM-dependent RNA methyltransferase [Candidatus Woesearchaeota archaeon]